VVTDAVFIGLGSNLGDREAHIRAALRDLEERGDIHVLRCSTLHETEPVNAVAQLQTDLAPRELLDRLLTIEQRHGRQRGVANGPRTLDLDLLLYGQRVINEQDLIIPHPRMWERPFVMQPLAEICDPETLAAWPTALQVKAPASGRADQIDSGNPCTST
jgi:2-amino-4-hydroxy-6-hydroxymethyldihydropteridine diphosphokinase